MATGKLDVDTDEVEYTRNKYDDDDNEEDEGESGAARELALDDPNHPRAVEPRPVRIHLLVNVKISIKNGSTGKDLFPKEIRNIVKIQFAEMEIPKDIQR